jgi:hypothetical protein
MRGVLMGLPKEIADLIERFDRNLNKILDNHIKGTSKHTRT